jgi:hypothetical protein
MPSNLWAAFIQLVVALWNLFFLGGKSALDKFDWASFLAVVEGLLKSEGPVLEPVIEAWLNKLPIPAPIIQILEALLKQYLNKPVTLKQNI